MPLYQGGVSQILDIDGNIIRIKTKKHLVTAADILAGSVVEPYVLDLSRVISVVVTITRAGTASLTEQNAIFNSIILSNNGLTLTDLICNLSVNVLEDDIINWEVHYI